MILVSRCLERIGDHAVDIGEQTAYLVTGEFREFTDASHSDVATQVANPLARIRNARRPLKGRPLRGPLRAIPPRFRPGRSLYSV